MNILNENCIDLDKHLSIMMFLHKTTYKVATMYIPYHLVYALHSLMLTQYVIPSRTEGLQDANLVRILINQLHELGNLQEYQSNAQENIAKA